MSVTEVYMWLLSLPYHMEGWRQDSSFLWKRDRGSCQVAEKYWQWLSWEETETPFRQQPTPILRWKTFIPPSNSAVSSPAGASLGKHPLLCLGPMEILWPAQQILSQQHWPCLRSWSLLIAFLTVQNVVNSQLATVKHDNGSEAVSPACCLASRDFVVVSCLSLHWVWSSSSIFWQFGAQCPIFRQQESNRAHISPRLVWEGSQGACCQYLHCWFRQNELCIHNQYNFG